MVVQAYKCRREVAVITAIVLGVASCTDSPTGIPDKPAPARIQARHEIRTAETCYLIDGQIYCVGTTPVHRDTATPRS